MRLLSHRAKPVRVILQAIFHPTVVEEGEEAASEHFRLAGVISALCARMHNGKLNAYAGYVFIALIVVITVGIIIHQ